MNPPLYEDALNQQGYNPATDKDGRKLTRNNRENSNLLPQQSSNNGSALAKISLTITILLGFFLITAISMIIVTIHSHHNQGPSGKRDVTFWPCDKAPQGTTRQKRRERHYVNMAGCLLGKRHEYMTSKRQKSSKKGRKGRKYYNRNVRKYTVKKQKQYMNLYPFIL